MSERMSDEEFAELMEGMKTGALQDWTKHNHPAQLAIREQARRAEAAEAKVAEYELYLEQHPRNLMNVWRAAEARVSELEASALGGYEDGWHALRAERDGLKAKLEAVRGLVEKWLDDCMNFRCTGQCSNKKCADELEALLK